MLQLGDEVYLSSHIIEANYGKDYVRMTKELKIFMYTTKQGEHINYINDWKYGVEELFIHLLRSSSYLTQVSDLSPAPLAESFHVLLLMCRIPRKPRSSFFPSDALLIGRRSTIGTQPNASRNRWSATSSMKSKASEYLGKGLRGHLC